MLEGVGGFGFSSTKAFSFGAPDPGFASETGGGGRLSNSLFVPSESPVTLFMSSVFASPSRICLNDCYDVAALNRSPLFRSIMYSRIYWNCLLLSVESMLNLEIYSAKSAMTFPWLLTMWARSLFTWSNASIIVLNAFSLSRSGYDTISLMLSMNFPIAGAGIINYVYPVYGL